jgi:ornithine cyclodeaminase/alanine dehydrogenase
MGMSTTAPTPGVEYVIVLYDRETSRVAGFVDGHWVTAYRTAATSAAALDRLAPPRIGRLAVLGSGLEATMHVRAFRAVREIDELVVYSPTQASREAFATELDGQAVEDPRDAVADATVVLAAARSHGEVPIVHADWLAPSALVMSSGSTVPEQREIDVGVLEWSELIVCDDPHEVMHETGDLLEAVREGVAFEHKTSSLHALLAGELDERIDGAGRLLYKSVGSGLQDVIVAGVILERAQTAQLATSIPIEFLTKR